MVKPVMVASVSMVMMKKMMMTTIDRSYLSLPVAVAGSHYLAMVGLRNMNGNGTHTYSNHQSHGSQQNHHPKP